jgi:branched-chain amino acid transport system substrate-binding protein
VIVKSRKRIALGLPLALLLTTSVFGATTVSGHNRTANTAMTMTIGDVESYTGDVGALGPAADKSIKLAVGQLNKASKEDGLKIRFKLTTADDQSAAQTAVLAAKRLVDAGATCLTGPEITPNAIAILDSVTLAQHIPMFPEATSIALRSTPDDHTIWRTVPPDNLQAKALAIAVEEHLGTARGKTVAVGYENVPYGAGIADAFKTDWESLGGKITALVGYNAGQPSYDSVAAAIVQGHPDAYVFADYPQTFATVADSLLRTGQFNAHNLFVSDALAVSPIATGIPAAAENGAFATFAGSPTGTPLAKAFNTLYLQAPGPRRSSLDTNEFDSGILCGLAAVAADSTSPARLNAEMPKISGPAGKQFTYLNLAAAMKALRAGVKIHYEGVSGPIDFNSQGDTSSGLYDLSTWKNGKLVLVKQIQTKK